MPVDTVSSVPKGTRASATHKSQRIYEHFAKNYEKWQKSLLNKGFLSHKLKENGDVIEKSAAPIDESTGVDYSLAELLEEALMEHPDMFPTGLMEGNTVLNTLNQEPTLKSKTPKDDVKFADLFQKIILSPVDYKLEDDEQAYLDSKLKEWKLDSKAIHTKLSDRLPQIDKNTDKEPDNSGQLSLEESFLKMMLNPDSQLFRKFMALDKLKKSQFKANGTSGQKDLKNKGKEDVKPKPEASLPVVAKHASKHSKLEQTKPKLESTSRKEEGFDLYGTKDEEGLCTYDDDDEYEDVDDYDIEELEDEIYGGGTEHRFELELQPECDIHGTEDCDCPVYSGDLNEEESYDFTFEYNNAGKLVPTKDSVKEYFRAQKKAYFTNSNKIQEVTNTKPKSKPKKVQEITFNPESNTTCLFCDFEALYGYEPVNLIKWADRKLEQDRKPGVKKRA